ncbi:MAG: ATP-binding protein [Bdellovibrionota bacterium]|nr:ATP-binding protein [Bdellovibrionota bacterium]
MKKSLKAPSLAIWIFGLSLGTLSLFFMLEREESKIKSRTLAHGSHIKEEISRELLRSDNVLRSIGALFQSSNVVTKQEFDTFCRNSIYKDIPLHIIEWQPKVAHENIRSFLKKAKASGVDNLELFEIDKKGKRISLQQRDFHFPVLYSYSVNSTLDTVGLDLAFSPQRMESKYESMRSGGSILTGVFGVIVKGSKDFKQGFALSRSVYTDSTISSSSNESFKFLKGFLAMVLYVEDFFKPLKKGDSHLFFQFSITDKLDNEIIFNTVDKEKVVEEYKENLSIEVGGRIWIINIYPTKHYIQNNKAYLPWVVLTLIFILSTAIALFVYLREVNLVKLREYERQIEKKQRLESLGVLASGVAHEFNNILQCISLANDNLNYSFTHNSGSLENFDEYIRTTSEYCQRGRGLVRQILSFARQDQGTMKDILVSDEIQRTVNLLSSSIDKSIQLKLELKSIGETTFRMNSNHISQIIINLCNNAIHAMTQGGVLTVKYDFDENKRIISVKDTGTGIDNEIQGKIFDPFFTTKSVSEGTGLGLSVIYGIVKSYDGQIELKSELNVGSEFVITLPSEE